MKHTGVKVLLISSPFWTLLLLFMNIGSSRAILIPCPPTVKPEIKRRRLSMQEQYKNCVGIQYDVFLAEMHEHFAYLIEPANENDTNFACPVFVLHSIADSKSTVGKYMTVARPEDVARLDDDAKFLAGKRSLQVIMDSFNEVDAGMNATATSYEAVVNNCGGFIKNLGEILELPFSDDMRDFIASRLRNFKLYWSYVYLSTNQFLLTAKGEGVDLGNSKNIDVVIHNLINRYAW